MRARGRLRRWPCSCGRRARASRPACRRAFSRPWRHGASRRGPALGLWPGLSNGESIPGNACVVNSSELRKLAETRDILPLGTAPAGSERSAIAVAGLRILPFATSHDAAASFGFRVDAPDGDALGYLTDSGVVTGAAHAALHDVRILALESNHDETMLKDDMSRTL